MSPESKPFVPEWPFGGSIERRGAPRIYSRAEFLALLDQHPEWKVREALEQGNIPSTHQKDALDWIAARAGRD